MILLVLATFCSIWLVASGLELPPYINKCSLSDPNLRQCIVTSANAVIPRLVNGERSLNWPVLSSLPIPELELPGPGFTVMLRNVLLEGLENFRVTDVNLDLKRKGQTAFFANPVYVLTADYTIQDQGVFTRSTLGAGKMRVALGIPNPSHRTTEQLLIFFVSDVSEQNTLQYDCDLDQIEKNGDVYLKFENVRLSLKTARIFYNFWDFYASHADNFAEFISKHKEIVDYRVRPAVEQLTLDSMQLVLNNVADRVPLKDIFDP